MAVRVADTRRRPEVSIGGEAGRILRNLDYVLLGAVAALVAYGLWVLASVSQNDVPGDPDFFLVRQSVNVAIGVAVLALATALNPELYRRLRVPLYAAALILLTIVFVADQVRGTRRWIDIGFFQNLTISALYTTKPLEQVVAAPLGQPLTNQTTNEIVEWVPSPSPPWPATSSSRPAAAW